MNPALMVEMLPYVQTFVIPLVYQALGIPIALMLLGLIVRGFALLGVKTSKDDQELMEGQLKAALGAGLARATQNFTVPATPGAQLAHATNYLMERFPGRAIKIVKAAGANAGGEAAEAIQQTLASRLPNSNSQTMLLPGLEAAPQTAEVMPGKGVAAPGLSAA